MGEVIISEIPVTFLSPSIVPRNGIPIIVAVVYKSTRSSVAFSLGNARSLALSAASEIIPDKNSGVEM